MTQFKYRAFISYCHADSRWADWLHKALERYRVPRRLVGRPTADGAVPARLFPVFRDRDELAGSSELGGALQQALRDSLFQIVICSPNAARSRWVGEEIRYFKSLGRSARVLALIVDGEPGADGKGQPELECFPETLRFHVDGAGQITATPAEQVAADARPHADGRANALLKLIAGILGVGFDELRQRELQARNRRLAVLASVASAVAAVTVVLAVLAAQARDDALRRQQQAEDLLQFMLGDLRDKLEPIGKLSILDAVGRKGMEYFATLDQRDLTDTALSSRAKALRQIGEVRMNQGDMRGAAESFGEALKLEEELTRRHPEDLSLLRNLAKSLYTMGELHFRRGEVQPALDWWQRQAATAQRVLELEPAQPESSHDFANALMNLGAVHVERGHLDRAEVEFRAALERQRALVKDHPAELPYLNTLSLIHGWLNNLEVARRNWQGAVEQGQHYANTLRRMTELAPDNVPYQYALANANLQTLYAEARLRAVAPDTDVLRETLALTQSLAVLDPENIQYAQQRVVALNYLANAHAGLGHWNAADSAQQDGLALARANHARAPANSELADSLLGILGQAARVAWLRGDLALARAHLREAAALPLSPELRRASVRRLLDLSLLEWWMSLRSREAARHEARATELLAELKASGQSPGPELMLRYEALRGDRAQAAQWFGQLTEVERETPGVQRFCRDTAACGGTAG